ncbi:SAM-dependent methyltransferase [Streptomyces lonarensis]|uniref:Class I SAM-dependent methyltransferase n=1 Tax=Streptomyces lonarensis TaxID=700599 RepID=A0A7X6CYS8_9ACTN|nr:class I SAM-dependent methyltransferase [Streptomyces lonarensis]NJQ05052.1 class I SAM-dependent methyltransferase [Streptomyces lonarensis]
MDAYHRHTVTHADHPVAAPLSDRAVAVILDRAVPRDRAVRLLDLGCGEAVWLRRALAARPEATAVGIDLDEPGLAVGRRAAEREGVADRLRLVREDAALHVSDRPAGTVLCVGATHAFGGLLPTLEAAHSHLADGGTVVVGEGFWERQPDAAALTALGCGPDAYDDLPGTVRRVTDAGWVPVYGHVSTAEEWDDYEWSWTGSLARWALDHPDHPSAAEAAATAREHRDAWLGGYRGTLGFLTLTLRPA